MTGDIQEGQLLDFEEDPVKSVKVVYLFFLNRGTVSSAVLGSSSR